MKSEPRNWEKELSRFLTERRDKKLQRNQFFSNEKEKNADVAVSEKSVDVSAIQYKLNRNKHRDAFVKEKREEFRDKFTEFKKEKV